MLHDMILRMQSFRATIPHTHSAAYQTARLMITSGTARNCLVDIFYRIRQVARVAKLVLECAFGNLILDEGEVS